MVVNAEHITSTLSKISDLCGELSDTNSSSLSFGSKLRGVILVAELYDIAKRLNEQREKTLSLYFGDNSLRENLQNIVQIEDIQYELSALDCLLSDENLEEYAEKINQTYFNQHITTKLPVQGSIWGANRQKPNSKYKFTKIFHAAQENLTEPQILESLSIDPCDKDYNISIKQNLLEQRYAFEANTTVLENTNGDFSQSLSRIYEVVSKHSANDILKELQRSLEILRVNLMRNAQDIYYIRTGNFAEILTKENQQDIKYYYTDLPLRQYFEIRNEVREEINETIDLDIEEWRINKGYTSRKLTQKEYLDFLNEQEVYVREQMKKGYYDLWVIREHSGGLNENVTPENFARMFFQRKDVDRQFLELQWKYELILELIQETEQRQPCEKFQFSPEEAAVKQFVENVCTLVFALHEAWNGKVVQTGVHQPEVTIVIKAQELIDYMEDMRNNNFKELSKWCYPSTSNNKINFVKFIASLRDKGYFGKLPNNLIAQQLAPIIMLAVGTATNYLSIKD